MRIEEIKEILAEIGLKKTPQRMEIIKFIFENNHCSAFEIKEYTDKVLPTVSFSTIYLTLNKLMEAGKLIPVSFEPNTIRYDTKTAPHYHIICTECGIIKEIEFDPYDKFTPDEFSGYGFSNIEGYEIHFFGTCKKCEDSV